MITKQDKIDLNASYSRYRWASDSGIDFDRATYEDANKELNAILKRLDLDILEAQAVIWEHICEERESNETSKR